MKDKDLILQVANGDERAFEALYNSYWELLFRIAYNKVQSVEISKELVQDLFTELWFKRENLNNIRDIKPYLIGALKYTVLDYIRKQTVRDRYVKEVINTMVRNDYDCFENVSYHETRNVIFEEIDRLPQQCKKVFKLSRFEHLPVKEIALKLSLSPKTVENHIGRALKILKANLKDNPAYLEAMVLLFVW
ncbi:MAG: RNA polymerase sigma-70 factor [Cyclobacteriaceae bacterium]